MCVRLHVFSFISTHGGLGLQRDGISNVCDLAHIWSYTLHKGVRVILAHKLKQIYTLLINLVLLTAAGPDFAPAKTDVGGSST